MYNIGFIGQGFVGGTLSWAFSKKVKPFTYDIIEDKSNTSSMKELINKSEVIFVCLPTPMRSDGTAYLKIVEDSLDVINDLSRARRRLVITKSTVPPGTHDKWFKKYKNINLVFNPEFLTEKNAKYDFINQRHIILGTNNQENFEFAKNVFSIIFDDRVSYHNASYSAAEMTKYFRNCLLATKVSFCNEIKQICNAADIDYDSVANLAHLDEERLGNSHYSVPGHDGDFGFGGHCFPKDLNALIKYAEKNKILPEVLSATWRKNKEVRSDKDWETMKGRAVINE